jgi:hypothetical protein
MSLLRFSPWKSRSPLRLPDGGSSEAAQTMIVHHSPESRRLTLGADKAYDARVRRQPARPQRNTAHCAEHDWRTSAVDALTTRHPGYAISQKKRNHTEEPFGWDKTIGGLAPAHAARSRTLEVQVHLDDGRLRPDPVAQLARLARMTRRRFSMPLNRAAAALMLPNH